MVLALMAHHPRLRRVRVAGSVFEYDEAEVLEQRRKVDAETAPVAASQPVPAADRVGLVSTEGLDTAGRGAFILVGAARRPPAALTRAGQCEAPAV